MTESVIATGSTFSETVIRPPSEEGSSTPVPDPTNYSRVVAKTPIHPNANVWSAGDLAHGHLGHITIAYAFDSAEETQPPNDAKENAWRIAATSNVDEMFGLKLIDAVLVPTRVLVADSFAVSGLQKLKPAVPLSFLDLSQSGYFLPTSRFGKVPTMRQMGDVRMRQALRMWSPYEAAGRISAQALLFEPQTAVPELVSYVGLADHQSKRDALIARFRLLRRLPDNHDNEGASAANRASVDAAIALVYKMSTSTPCSATLNDDGHAVIEFEDRMAGLYAEVTFLPSGRVEIYCRRRGRESVLFEDKLDSDKVRQFLADEVDVAF